MIPDGNIHPYRRSTDGGDDGLTLKELVLRVDERVIELERKLSRVEATFAVHEPLFTGDRRAIEDHEKRLRLVEEAHLVNATQQRMTLSLVKAVFGVSMIGAIAGVLTLIDIIQRLGHS